MTKTIREAHRWAFSYLCNRGVDEPEARVAAERLLRHLLKWDRARFFAHDLEAFPPPLWGAFERLVKARGAGVPLQHLVETQEFYGRAFHVNGDVLIPRPETEGLVEAVLGQADAMWRGRACAAADIGTGSGAIAVTLAAERPHWHVTATDISAAALRTARRNAERHAVDARIQFLQGDALSPLIRRRTRVDLVASNPPYIPSADIGALAVEVRKHEPRLALDGGRDGLDVYRRIVSGLPRVMKEAQGLVAFEVGIGQSGHVAEMLKTFRPGGKIRIIPDLAGILRVVMLSW